MSEHEAAQSPQPAQGDLYTDERYIVRDPQQIRVLMQALIDQRATLSVHPDGRGPSFLSVVLGLGENTLLLDGSPLSAINRRAVEAAFLLCHAQVDKVNLRFRVEQAQEQEQDGYVGLHAPIPREVFHLQRRELYRVATPLDDAPWCSFPDPEGGEPLRWRVLDVSAGGIALMLPADQKVFTLDQRCPGCELELSDGVRIPVTLTVRNLVPRQRADGTHQVRVGLRFEDLPRGADAAIQRHIFSIERKRAARLRGYA